MSVPVSDTSYLDPASRKSFVIRPAPDPQPLALLLSWSLQVARCTKIINADSEDPKYIINVKQFAKFVVDLADSVAPTDIEVEFLNVPLLYDA